MLLLACTWPVHVRVHATHMSDLYSAKVVSISNPCCSQVDWVVHRMLWRNFVNQLRWGNLMPAGRV